MRGWKRSYWLVTVAALLGVFALTASAAEGFCACLDVDSAFRVSGNVGGMPLSLGDLRLEGVLGLPEWSSTIWADVHAVPVPAMSFGGEAKLIREWLSIGMRTQPEETTRQWIVVGQATPAAWMLYEGVPSLVGGISATAQATLLGERARTEITASPLLTGIIPSGNITVSPSIGLDLGLDSDGQHPVISGARLVSTINANEFLVSSTVHFDGAFEEFSSLAMSVNIPGWGLVVSGTLIPTPMGDFSFRVGLTLEWGDTYLLSEQAEKPEAVCTGGVCF